MSSTRLDDSESSKAQVEAYTPLFIHKALLGCSASLKQMLLQLGQNEITLNTRCNVS